MYIFDVSGMFVFREKVKKKIDKVPTVVITDDVNNNNKKEHVNQSAPNFGDNTSPVAGHINNAYNNTSETAFQSPSSSLSSPPPADGVKVVLPVQHVDLLRVTASEVTGRKRSSSTASTKSIGLGAGGPITFGRMIGNGTEAGGESIGTELLGIGGHGMTIMTSSRRPSTGSYTFTAQL